MFFFFIYIYQPHNPNPYIAGPRAAGKNALIGGILLAAIEGLGILITKMMAPPVATAEQYAAQGQQDPLEPPSMMPSFGGSSSLSGNIKID